MGNGIGCNMLGLRKSWVHFALSRWLVVDLRECEWGNRLFGLQGAMGWVVLGTPGFCTPSG